MTDPILIDRMFNVGTEKKPDWRRLRYLVSGSNICDRFPDKSGHELAMERTGKMLRGKAA